MKRVTFTIGDEDFADLETMREMLRAHTVSEALRRAIRHTHEDLWFQEFEGGTLIRRDSQGNDVVVEFRR